LICLICDHEVPSHDCLTLIKGHNTEGKFVSEEIYGQVCTSCIAAAKEKKEAAEDALLLDDDSISGVEIKLT